MRRLFVALAALAVSIGLLVAPAMTPAGASTRQLVVDPFTPAKGIAVTLGYADKLTDAKSMAIANSLMSLIANTLHANSVSLNFPIWQKGSFSNNPQRAPMTPSPQRMIAITEVAHRYGLSVQWRPYIYEGDLQYFTHNSIHPSLPGLWFASYWAFMRPYLVAASQSGVASFSIALELRSMLPYLDQWTNLVRRAKGLYSGELLYSQQHEPQVSIPLTARGYDAYQPIKLASQKEVSAAAFMRGFERNLRVPGSQSSPADMTLEEVGITATKFAYNQPAQSFFPRGTPIIRRVQTDWFAGACDAFWALHLRGIYFYSIPFDRFTGAKENDSGSYGGWLGTSTETAIEHCFERTSAPVAPGTTAPGTTAAGTSAPHALHAASPSVGWDPATQVEPTGGHASSISCPTATFCAEVDLSGVARTEHAGTWSAPATIDANPLSSVSCASATLCVAVDSAGNALTYDGSAWTEQSAVDPLPLTSVSCAPSTTTCAAVDVGGGALFDRAGTWTAPAPLATDPLNAVSCASAAFCVAVDNAGAAYTYTKSWSAPRHLGPNAIGSVACPSVGFCLAGDDAGHLYRDLASTWTGRANVVPGGAVSIACSSNASCVAISRGQLVTITGGLHWSPAISIFPGDDMTAVTCAPSGPCTALSYGGSVATNAAWTKPTRIDARSGNVTSVACGSATFCMAADDAGNVSTYNGSSWSALRPTGLPSVSGISCVGGFCMAVSNSGQAVSYQHGAWGHPKLIDRNGPLTSVSCISASFCGAADAANAVLRFTGVYWSRPKVESMGLTVVRGYTSISCASPTFCVAVDTHGDALVFGGGHYVIEQAAPPGVPITGISCPTTTTCVAVDDQGREATYNGSGTNPGWSLSQPVDPFRLTSVSCTATMSCLATDDNGGTVALSGGVWTPSSRTVPLDGTLSAVSCAGSGTCAVTTAAEAAVGVVS